jgi:hypothetical protein
MDHERFASSSREVAAWGLSGQPDRDAICVLRTAVSRDASDELAALERSGALMAKKAAETIRKVWICRLFMAYSFVS